MNLVILTQKVDLDDAILGFFVEWLEKIAQVVDRLQVITLEKGPFQLPSNVEVISLGREEGAGLFTMGIRFNRTLHKVCRKKKPDGILAHMVPKYVLYALPLACLYRIPMDLWYTHKGVDKYLRVAHPFLRFAFTASEESFRLPSKKKVVVGHGINTERFKPEGERDGRSILTVGRITPSKDQQVVVEALALLKDRGLRDELKVSVIGEPLLNSDRVYLAKIEDWVRRRSLQNLIRFEGAVHHRDMAKYYRKARILVNASHTGSVDKVVLEAMAAGALPLTCNESFVPILGDLAARLVFEKRNPEDLAHRIETLLDLKESEYQDLAKELRARVVSQHNLDNLVEKILNKMRT